VRILGHNQGKNDAAANGDDTLTRRLSLVGCTRVLNGAWSRNLHDEKPTPTRNSISAVKSQTGGGDESTKCTSQHLKHEESSQSLPKLVLGVPCAKEVDDTGEEDGLRDAEQNTQG